MNDPISQLIGLMHLKHDIAYLGYDKLNLKELDPLRAEVADRIEDIISKDKEKRRNDEKRT